MVRAKKGVRQPGLVALTAEQRRAMKGSLLSGYLSLEFWSANGEGSSPTDPLSRQYRQGTSWSTEVCLDLV